MESLTVQLAANRYAEYAVSPSPLPPSQAF